MSGRLCEKVFMILEKNPPSLFTGEGRHPEQQLFHMYKLSFLYLGCLGIFCDLEHGTLSLIALEFFSVK
jgi:hypothetical protein